MNATSVFSADAVKPPSRNCELSRFCSANPKPSPNTRLIHDAGIIIEPFTVEQAHVTRQTFHDFEKGRQPAGLNFGDCFAYALSKVTGEPPLFRGKDFRKTDVESPL
jgi:uncharacterized protein with PIN domain